MAFQAKAIYFIDANGNAIEFINPIHKDWVNDYVSEDTTFDTQYPDIPVPLIEDLVHTVNNPFGIELFDITIIPI